MCRPRTVSFSPEKMIELGEELVAYVKKHRKTILHISEWYTIEKGFIYAEWEQFITRPEFRPYYEQALKIIGLKYVDKNSNVRDGIAHRWQRIYFNDLRKAEDEDATENELRKAASLKSEARIIEQEKIKVLEEIQRGKRKLK